MIERIIIENFKSIRKLDLELNPINILIGANGAGKSNFLSFFELVNYYNARGFEPNLKRDANKYLHYGRKKK
jgi:predicted ATPase